MKSPVNETTHRWRKSTEKRWQPLSQPLPWRPANFEIEIAKTAVKSAIEIGMTDSLPS